MMNRRVVISGMGVVSPIGVGVTAFRESLRNGVCGAAPITRFDAGSFPVKTAFEVKNFDAREHGTYVLDPFIQYAVAAASEAMRNAYFDSDQVDAFRIGISVSSSKGGVSTIDRFKERLQRNPSAILGARVYTNSVPNFGAQWIARRWKIKGPAKCYVGACATGTISVIEGARMVASGVVDYCIAGASDASIVPLMLAGYYKMGALAKERMRPFDRQRDGFMVGEGAGIVFLETPETARARKATIYGELLASAYGSDSHHPVKFDPKGKTLSRTIQRALGTAELKRDDVDYISLHGTATRAGDVYETNQLKDAFGAKAYEIPMSSIKAMTGHMLGASGAVEIVASLLAMEEGFIPQTVGLEKADPECDLDYTGGSARAAEVNTVLSYSMGFGGHVAAVVLQKV
ncbi:MAG: beta-ketoacyl-[acyl-carrier-protein] synthase family protein [Candidatus Omnitrophota bacterium]|nr:beta-ketoacyl-[acyl-carrier-protein] synthase family protein [Candidatus Omnitrophota bacterium]